MSADARRLNARRAELLVGELVRSGVDFFCLAPGSRSTPLVTAVARNPRARHVMHFDERGTAFFALGCARATGRPACWVTTSGTAVANGMPAVVEAASDGVPMLLLTADRPPELRETGANQTIRQPGIFGDYVRWEFDLPAPDMQTDPAMVLTTVDQAVYRARRAPAGPVHLNCMFRKPLAPRPDAPAAPLPSTLDGWREGDVPYTRYSPTSAMPDPAELDRLWRRLRAVERGLVVAGRLGTPARGEAAAALADALGWPLLPDIGSQARLGGAGGVGYYDLLLSDEAFAEAHAPESVLYIGRRATSKPLSEFLARHRPDPFVVVREDPSRFDPHHQVTRRIEADVERFCAALADRAREDGEAGAGSWAESWAEASRAARGRLDRALSTDEELSEPLVARLVSRRIPDGRGLFLASSMPVRDMDAFAAAERAAVRVAANRGASGIDGTIASAAGFARGLGAPVTLVIGDLALLHDLNSLALLADTPVPVTVVAVNNRGGGIFSFLPIAEHKDVFEPYFGTPHEWSFERAAEMFGVEYTRPSAAEAFVEAYRAASRGQDSTLIEVRTDREENRALHRRLRERVSAVTS